MVKWFRTLLTFLMASYLSLEPVYLGECATHPAPHSYASQKHPFPNAKHVLKSYTLSCFFVFYENPHVKPVRYTCWSFKCSSLYLFQTMVIKRNHCIMFDIIVSPY